jgi:two-component system, OmpR family, response regulator
LAKNGNNKIRIFSALEVANLCGVVNQTAINWIKNGYLKAFTTPGGQYRVYSDELMKFLKSQGMRIPKELETIESAETDSTILIVEDDTEINDLIKQFFEIKLPEYKIYQAFDGFEAGKSVSENKPSILILDITLPGVDGYTLCKNIKSDPNLNSPYIIAITGMSEEDAKQKILESGADAFYKKPLNMQELVNKIIEFTGG